MVVRIITVIRFKDVLNMFVMKSGGCFLCQGNYLLVLKFLHLSFVFIFA